MYIASLGLFLM